MGRVKELLPEYDYEYGEGEQPETVAEPLST
jgi:hypothetical protein